MECGLKMTKQNNQRITTSFKIDKTIRDKFKIYCIEKSLDMSDVLEKLIEQELKRNGK